MKLADVTEEGFYFARAHFSRLWSVIYVEREAQNPANPKYNTFVHSGHSLRGANKTSYIGIDPDLVGPILQPNSGKLS